MGKPTSSDDDIYSQHLIGTYIIILSQFTLRIESSNFPVFRVEAPAVVELVSHGIIGDLVIDVISGVLGDVAVSVTHTNIFEKNVPYGVSDWIEWPEPN